ncbi:MAG TPA: alpha amylase C-terminal domain-containing protein, partial [Rubellimicrobium sp.]|nr:alpha amylase C-terminal domain-containing protein [Rubellimicrobium sp.]
DAQIDWDAVNFGPEHRGSQRLIRDLNTLYRAEPALHARDCEPEGFQWVEGGDAENSILAWIRWGFEEDEPCVVVCNFTPVERRDHRIGLPLAGRWTEVMNTDAAIYYGGNRGNQGGVLAEERGWMGQPFSAPMTLPPLSTLIFKLDR